MLILRDPFNLFASRLTCGFAHVNLRTAARIWCSHAREYLGLRRQLGPERVMISYNRWVVDAGYRRGLSALLGLSFDDSTTRHVPRTGGGSSFDGRLYDGRADQMGVFDRWRRFAGDDTYRSIFSDELLALSEQAFGVLPAQVALAEAAGGVAA